MIDHALTPHERELIEHARKVNKLMSLYVLAVQERKPLTVDEHGGLVQALRGVADMIEQESQRVHRQLATNVRPVIEGSMGDGTPAEA